MNKQNKPDRICDIGTAILIGLFIVYIIGNSIILKGGF